MKLYDEVIRHHHHHPYHFMKVEGCSHLLSANNFICGDKFEFCIQLNGHTIESIYFHGFGCAVSKASGSILAECLENKSIDEAIAVGNQFLRVLNNEITEGEVLDTEAFQSFAIVNEIPARYDCAALAWQEVIEWLKHH